MFRQLGHQICVGLLLKCILFSKKLLSWALYSFWQISQSCIVEEWTWLLFANSFSSFPTNSKVANFVWLLLRKDEFGVVGGALMVLFDLVCLFSCNSCVSWKGLNSSFIFNNCAQKFQYWVFLTYHKVRAPAHEFRALVFLSLEIYV